MSIIFFISIFLILLFVIFFAALWALSKIAEDYAYTFWKRIIVGVHFFAVIVFVSGYALFMNQPFVSSLIRLATVIVVSEFLFVIFVLISLAISKCVGIFTAPVPYSRSRRNLLKGTFMYPAAAIGATVYGVTEGVERTVEREYQIPVKNLPENLKGFRIAQISDVHLGMFFSLDKLKELMNQVAEGKPDALVMTGDIFDSVQMNSEAIKIIDGYADKFPKGIWYCFGNHEHFRGIDAITEALKNTKIRLLNNEGQVVVDGKRPLYFLGVDYPPSREEKKFDAEERAFVAESLKDVPRDAVKVLLAHHSAFIDAAREQNIELTLTGHTHGSQIGLFGFPLLPIFKYTRGFYNEKDCFAYVHSGNGSWFPYRFGCPPEIAFFSFRNG